MIELFSMTLADALLVVGKMRENDRAAMRAALGDVTDDVVAVNRWQTRGPAWVMTRDGQPVAICGLSMGSEWAATAWLITTNAMRADSWRKLVRHCRTVLSNMPRSTLHRIEAQVLDGWAEAGEFVRRMGFVLEGTRRRAGKGGEGFHVWSILKE